MKGSTENKLKPVSMTRKCQNHIPHPNAWHHKELTHNTDSHSTARTQWNKAISSLSLSLFLRKILAKLKRALRTTPKLMGTESNQCWFWTVILLKTRSLRLALCWYRPRLTSFTHSIWAATWDFQQCGMCDQQRLRPACAYAQTDQSLC